MNYTKLDNKIVINDLTQFNINQILDCGQIFRYNIVGNMAEVISLNHYAQIFTYPNKVEIATLDIEYFEQFFDLDRDYNAIKKALSGDEFLSPAIKFGYGIRILNQNLFEMLVSFIISANNNIKRIKNSLNYLSKAFGTKTTVKCCHFKSIEGALSTYNNGQIEYYAFPTLEQLKKASIDDYTKAGLGYRAPYMYDTIQKLNQTELNKCVNSSFDEQLKWLMSLKGVGEKVAHCIMLFALHSTTVFPVDTWINKVYNDLTNTINTNRKQISAQLTNRYKSMSGYAQQYFFYYYRSNK